MILDNLLTLSNGQAVTSSAASSSIIDITGAGSGNAPGVIIGSEASVFGTDVGLGDGLTKPAIACIVGTAFVGVGASLTVALQTAPDNGSNAPGTWSTAVQTDTIAVGNLTAGAKLAQFEVPPRDPGAAAYRFIRLYYTVASGPFTGGTIGYAGINLGTDEYYAPPANY